ncbi:MAG: class 1 fructose-bisphosphatase [Myxococcota bacterium]
MNAEHSWGPPPETIMPGLTLERHIHQRQRSIPTATGDLTGLLQQIGLAAKIVASKVHKAGLAGILGLTGDLNIQGEEVQKLDIFANNVLVRSVEGGGHVCVMASEEVSDIIPVPEQYAQGKYVLMFDPLDGSGNIDINASIGTIFSVHRRKTASGPGTLEDCLQPGHDMVAAGYIIYGSSDIFVYSTGDGVHGFTLDPAVGEFFLSHENIVLPSRGDTYSINEGYYARWDEGVRRWVEHMKTPDKDGGRPYSMRYIGAMVADFHRTLLRGGIFAYPADEKNRNGKLRLLYEASPLAFIAEAAGGAATDGHRRILDVEPRELHQRTPLFIGSREDVRDAVRIIHGDDAVTGAV